MGDPGLGKMLLIVAGALGVLQGFLTLIGGSIAVFDKDKGVAYYDAFQNDKVSIEKDNNGVNRGPNQAEQNRLLIGLKVIDNTPNDVRNDKYHCGVMGIKLKMGLNPNIINNKDDKTKDNKVYEKMDRGWYRRVHDYCRKSNHQGLDTDRNRKICDLSGYGVIVSYAITCGLGWIAAGAVAILATVMSMQLIGFAAAGIFAVIYIIFIGLFSAGWHSVRRFDQKCLNDFCRAIRRHGKKSSHEFLAYSICAFILILAAIGLSAYGAIQLDNSEMFNKDFVPNSANPDPVNYKSE